MKVCNFCKKELSLDNFKWRNDTQNYKGTCISCDKLKARERYLKNSNPSYRRGDISYPDKFCLNCGKLLKKKGGSKYEKLKFCSKRCHYNFKRNSEKYDRICPICNASFKHYNKKFCSKECMLVDRSNRNKTLILNCDFCGKEIKVWNSTLKITKHHFCNKECFFSYQKINPLNMVDKIVKICKICNKEFEVYPSYEKQSKRKGYEILYCSIECRNSDTEEMSKKSIEMNKLQSNKTGLNKIEKEVKDILDSIGLKCNVDYYPQYKLFNKFLVDFFIVKQNLVIQCDGDYWHGYKLKNGIPDKRQEKRMKYDKSQDSYLKKCNVNILRFWEHEILNNKGVVYDTIKRTIFKIA